MGCFSFQPWHWPGLCASCGDSGRIDGPGFETSLIWEEITIVLTWVVPVGIMTMVPVPALSSNLPAGVLLGSVALGLMLLAGASALFQFGLRRYTSASSQDRTFERV
jgi:hypothetical protein